jgi:hypothetical protein
MKASAGGRVLTAKRNIKKGNANLQRIEVLAQSAIPRKL